MSVSLIGLTADEKRLYSLLFKALDPENSGIITGEKARSTFEKSGLPPTILGEIWQIADQNNLGFLTQFGFCFAMRLIGYTQLGQHPTAALAEQPGPLPKFANLNLPGATPQPLQPQSTNSSFMQSQPSSMVPQNISAHQAQPQNSISSISPQDYQRFSQLFIKTVGNATGELDGQQARDIFLKAKLPHTTLGQIWSLVDRFNRGSLDIGAFVIAMYLIQGLLSGHIKQLPPFLPENIWQSVGSQGPASGRQVGSRQASNNSISSQQTTLRHPSSGSQREVSSNLEWTVTPTLKQQYDSIFANLDKSKSGQLSPDQVASFLMTSKLNQQDLATVWDLADIQNTGVFTRLEFSIALFLVNKRLAGGKLPNVVPDELVESIKNQSQPQAQPQAPAQSQSQPQPQSQPAPIKQQKTAMDDLVDIFGSSSPAPVPAPAPVASPKVQPALQLRASSSDLTPTPGLPKVRNNLTGSFKPSSSFGQTLLSKQASPEQAESVEKAPEPPVEAPSSPAPVEKKSINYDALRSVPPPPPKKSTSFTPERPVSQSYSGYNQPNLAPHYEGRETELPAPVSAPSRSYLQQNDDLLADPETSGQLSQANSDIANVSNQIKSLATQTSGLHEKKLRADQELQRILTLKQEIESKLKVLRSSYDNEVKQVDQVEVNLAAAKEESEALRSESSIAEAKLNTLSTELNEKQVEFEELQKQNGSLKEKLSFVNAEIGELEQQIATKNAEVTQLANQVSVRKSQVQVALVKTQDFRSKIAELEQLNQRHREELQLAEQQEQQYQKEQQELAAKSAALRKESEENKAKAAAITARTPQSAPQSDSSHHGGAIAAAGAAIGAAVGGIAEVVGAHASNASETTSKEVNSAPSNPTPQPAPTSHKDVSGLVDEVQQNPSADMTGVDDLEEVNSPKPAVSDELEAAKSSSFPGAFVTEESTGSAGGETAYSTQAKDEEEQEELNKRFTEFPSGDSTNDNVTNATATSSIATEYKNAGDGETPVTSPTNSEYQFPQGTNAGIVGGLVGMPGGLVGVQRTDSLTSSVQNNAALSVRDDNIGEISDRETLDNEDVAPSSSVSNKTPKNVQGQEEARDSDGDKVSSGVESFELVNAEDANHQEEPSQEGSGDVEFPPIKELDYDEDASSSSEEEEGEESQQFDDAVDNLPKRDNSQQSHQFQAPAPQFDDFDNAFNDLTPATPELDQQNDFFADEFDGLEAAKEDTVQDDDFERDNADSEFDFPQGFTERASNVPDFSSAGNAETTSGNDEWEQLFAGFGNAAGSAPVAPEPAPVAAAAPATNAINPNDQAAVEELVGMGFEEHTALDALKKENWNLEAATNYLLDHA